MHRYTALLLVSSIGLSGCFFKKKVPDVGPDPHEGGTIMLSAPCNYSVTARYGATTPEPNRFQFGAAPTPYQVHLGIASDPATSMVVLWRSDGDTLATQVQYGENGATDKSTDGFTFAYENPVGDDIRMHETHLCGLKPDTEYSYRAGGTDGDGNQSFSPTYTFRTGPDLKAQPDAEVVILVIGDTRDGYDTWGASLAEAERLARPDLIMFSGDAVTLGPIQSEWDEWMMQAGPTLSRIPIIAAHGNHDVNSVNYFSQFALPGDEEYYGLQYGPVHVTVINDSPPIMSDLTSKGSQFLDADLAASASSPWKLALHHKPLWSASAGHGGDPNLLSIWGPIFDKYKPDIVFNGHDHDYERSKPMRGSTPQNSASDGTIYIVAGSAGAPLYDNGTGFWTDFSEKVNSLVLLRARAGSLQMNAYRPDGSNLDSLHLTK